jgi:hypothetical protein
MQRWSHMTILYLSVSILYHVSSKQAKLIFQVRYCGILTYVYVLRGYPTDTANQHLSRSVRTY